MPKYSCSYSRNDQENASDWHFPECHESKNNIEVYIDGPERPCASSTTDRNILHSINGNIPKMSSFKCVTYKRHRRGNRYKSRKFSDENSVITLPWFLLTKHYDWYRVKILHGSTYEKDDILDILSDYVKPRTLIPIMYKVFKKNAVFYIDNHEIAIKLLRYNCKFTMANGYKLHVRVKPHHPYCKLNDEFIERLKHVIRKRYRENTNILCLSKFHEDPDLIADYFCALSQPEILEVVLNIAAEQRLFLEGLYLGNNKLEHIEHLSMLSKKFPELKILHINDNRIKDFSDMDAIKDLQLDELKLIGNPICSKYNFCDYISGVQKIFPKLLCLDSEILSRTVFDVAGLPTALVELPTSQRLFVKNEKVYESASLFFRKYFMIFDSENRQPLLTAYEENAFFSITGWKSDNRNLLEINDADKREKLLKQGRSSVVSFISGLPRTKHLLYTVTMDISFITQTMITVTITGYFQELKKGHNNEVLHYFNRAFVIIPKGNSYCISNEQLHIGQPSKIELEQLKSIYCQEITEQLQESLHITVQSTPSNNMKQQMTIMLSKQTNMNLKWSLKCLQEMDWDYDNAVEAFTYFFKLGQVPSEAFAH